MIHLTRLNKTAIILNADLIEHLEVTPDTVICLTNGQKIRVTESAEQVLARVLQWRRLISAQGALPELVETSPDQTKQGSQHGQLSS